MRISLFSFCLLAACAVSPNGSSSKSTPAGGSERPSNGQTFIERLIGGTKGTDALIDGFGNPIEAAPNGDISNWRDFPRGPGRMIKFIGPLEGLDNSAYYQDDFLYTSTVFSSSILNAQRKLYSIPGIIVLTIDETGIFQAALDQTPTRDEIRIIDNAVDDFNPEPVREIAKRYYARGNFRPSVPNSSLLIGPGNSFSSFPWTPDQPVNFPFARKK